MHSGSSRASRRIPRNGKKIEDVMKTCVREGVGNLFRLRAVLKFSGSQFPKSGTTSSIVTQNLGT